MYLKEMTQDEAESYLDKVHPWREEYNTTADSSYSHLKSATYDWRVEQQWGKPNATFSAIMDGDKMVGFVCLSVTKRHPKTASIRHVSIFEPYRSGGYGRKTLELAHTWFIKHQAQFVRFFSDKKSVKFYEKCGFQWIGLSKSGLPFTLYPLNEKEFITNQESVYNNYEETISKMPEDLVRKQVGKLKESYFTLDTVFQGSTLNQFF